MTTIHHLLPKTGEPGDVARRAARAGETLDSNGLDSMSRKPAADMAPLRVLLVTEPGIDGVFRHVEALTHYLLKRGAHVDLAYSDLRGSDRLRELIEHVTAAGGRTLNLSVTNMPGPRDLPALLRLRQFAWSTRPHVIHAHSSKAGALVRALRFLGVWRSLFYTPHAYYGMGAPAGWKKKTFSAIERLLGRVGTTFNLSGCEMAFAKGNLQLPQKRLRLIPNPVDTQRFLPATPEIRIRLRQELGLPADALLLGSVGRLSLQKDPVTLYRSLAVAAQEVKSLKLYHLGMGELAAECNQVAQEAGIRHLIIRRDYLSDPLPFYQAIDAAILTSRYEGLSFAVLESLACDLPVILSEAPGNLDFLGLGLSHCWSAPPGNPGRMGHAIVQWARDHALRRESNHRAIAESRFSPETCFGAILAEYCSRARVRAMR